jgi:hypothetical protein
MHGSIEVTLLPLILFLLPALAAQRANQPDQPQTTRTPPSQQMQQADEEQPDGFWPTKRMIELFIQRMAIDAGGKFDLTQQQQAELESLMLETWPPFLEKERADLQPLINEFFEARLELEPPAKDRVQQWASRAEPLLERLKYQFESVNQQIRPILTPEQLREFESEITKQRLGLLAFEAQVAKWKTGNFEANEWWDRPKYAQDRRQTKAEQEVVSKSVQKQGPPPDQILLELSAWEQYVHEFATNYSFDERQQTTAQSILTEMNNRAMAHRSANLQEIADLEKKINAPDAKDDADIYDELVRLYQPIDLMFKELQDRLNRIPTRAQRAAATTQPTAEAAQQPTTRPAAPARPE